MQRLLERKLAASLCVALEIQCLCIIAVAPLGCATEEALGHIELGLSSAGATRNSAVSHQGSDRRVDRSVVIGQDGRLSGAMNGWAWIAGGKATTFASPNHCDERGCFVDSLGKLCTAGEILALSCGNDENQRQQCDWEQNWGALLGMDTNDSKAWGNDAPTRLALHYGAHARAGQIGTYNLMMHVSGEPDKQLYCIANYASSTAECRRPSG